MEPELAPRENFEGKMLTDLKGESFEHAEETIRNLRKADELLADLERKVISRKLYGHNDKEIETFVSEIDDIVASILGREQTKGNEKKETKTQKVKGVAKDLLFVDDIEEEDVEDDNYLDALFKHKSELVRRARLDYRRIVRGKDKAYKAIRLIEETIDKDGNLPIRLREKIDELKNLIASLDHDMYLLRESSEEAYYTINLLNLRDLKRQSENSKIIETASVKEKKEHIESFVLSGRPVFLKGAPGTGKTEMAIHVAENLPTVKEYRKESKYTNGDKLMDQPYRIISASKQTDSSELTGHQILTSSEMSEGGLASFYDSVDSDLIRWKILHPNATLEEINSQKNVFLKGRELTKGKGVETSFWTGPMYEAMELGIPFIVDEANALPPEVMIKINHLMTRRPGDKVRIQEDSGKEITIKKGFSFMFTGNIGSEYQGRHRLEQSFLNRIGDAMIEYGYLPAGELEQIIFARLMDGKVAKGSMVIREGDISYIMTFASTVSFAQEIFAGIKDFEISDGEGGKLSVNENRSLKNTPLSMRNVLNIIDSYKRDGFSKSFESYILSSFISPMQDATEQYVYYSIFKSAGFFGGTDVTLDRDVDGNILNVKFILNESGHYASSGKYKTYTGRDVVDFVKGSYEYNGQNERDYKKVKVEGVAELTDSEKSIKQMFNNMDFWASDLDDVLSISIKRMDVLTQDLTDLTKVKSFTLDTKPINPKQVLEKKEATSTQAGVYTWDNFDNWIRPNIQDTTLTPESIPITSFTLDRNMKGEELKKKLGKAKPFTIDQIATLINNQSEISGNTPKVTSPLDTSGRANLFLVEKADGSVVVVGTFWRSGDRKWGVVAYDLAYEWNGSNRVFSRNN